MFICVFKINFFAFISEECFVISIVHREEEISLFPQNYICKQHANYFPCVWKQFFTDLTYMDVSR